MSINTVKIIVKQYADEMRRDRIPFVGVYLFGSYARGNATPHSDIDVAVVMKSPGRGKDYLNRKMRLWELAPSVDARIEPILLAEGDVKQGATILAHEVMRHGMRIV